MWEHNATGIKRLALAQDTGISLMNLWYKTKSERRPLELEKGLDLLLCWFNQVRRPAEKFEYNKDKKEITIRPEEITFQKIKAITLKLRVISLLSFIYNKASVSLCLFCLVVFHHPPASLWSAVRTCYVVTQTQLQSHGKLSLSGFLPSLRLQAHWRLAPSFPSSEPWRLTEGGVIKLAQVSTSSVCMFLSMHTV